MSFIQKLCRKDRPPACTSAVGQPESPVTQTKDPNAFKVEVMFTQGEAAGEAVYWLTYALAKANYVSKHPHLYGDQCGMVVPSFEEEVEARGVLADLCSESVQQQNQPVSAYFSDLLRVREAGFIAEYVWLFLALPSWPAEVEPKQLPAFIGWVKQNLPHHEVKTFGGVKIERGGQSVSEVSRDIQNVGDVELARQAQEAVADAQGGRLVEAARKVAAIYHRAKSLQTDPGAIYVCFQNHAELNFFLTGHPEARRIRLLDWSVASAIFLKAFILSQARRFAEALSCLDEVTQLAPLMASARREEGYVLAQLRRPEESLGAYRNAWDLASRLPSNVGEAGRALRGMAVALVEMGELDRAEKLLHDSLLIDPANPIAIGELAYIERVRREGKPRKPHLITHAQGPASTD